MIDDDIARFRVQPIDLVQHLDHAALDRRFETEFAQHAMDILAWAQTEEISEDFIGGLEIPTLEGTMRADVGDWIIKGVAGEFYPCKPAVFEATYQRVTE